MSNVILRVKREDGSWAEIPALVGPPGPKGISIDDIVLQKKENGISTYSIILTDGSEKTFQVTDGAIITDISLISSDVLIDTYKITISDGSFFNFTIKNGRGITGIAKTGTDVLSDTYTISYNDNTTSTYNVTNGRSIVSITKTSTDVLTDTYTISYNDNTTSTFIVKNGRGINYIEKDEVIGLSDRYTIHYNDGTTSYYHVMNGEAGPAGSIGNRIYLSGLVDKVNDETGYERVKELYDSSNGTILTDTIKANNYTVSGTPTISNDGIATNLTSTDYISSTLNATPTQTVVLKGHYIYNTGTTHDFLMAETADYSVYGSISGTDFKLSFQPTSGSTVEKTTVIEIPLNDGDIMDYELTITENNINCNMKLNEGVNYALSMTNTEASATTFLSAITGIKQSQWTGTVDLNTLETFIDGSLVYQPCLKIPYMKSKTGSKIVDAEYKLRVESCYNQFGAGNYYLLDTVNEKFALPMPDIYGLINTLEDTKVNRAGDTMTGALSTPSYLTIYAPIMDKDVVPTVNQYSGITLTDKNFQRLSQLESQRKTDGSEFVNINQKRNIDGTDTYASLQVGFDGNNNMFTYAPHPTNKLDNTNKIATTNWVRNHCCTTPATTTSTASLDAPCYVIENYVNGTSWYRLYSDIWKEQGGTFVAGGRINGFFTQNLSASFSNSQYSVILTGAHGDTSNNNVAVPYGNMFYGCLKWNSKTTTSFMYGSNIGASWVAFGF